MESSDKNNFIKYLALYLPQFHTFKENDEWWGKGFTEWTNTKPMKPLFENHYQPHEPHDDIGYYNLSDVNIMIQQSKIAKKYGIYGFCYYYYWFNGKKLMEKPLENMLLNKAVDIPFCLFWANHNFTRAWDVGNKEVLQEQTYDENTYAKFVDDILPYLKDDRYIIIDGKHLLLVYEAHKIPNPKDFALNLKTYAMEKYGIDFFLVSIQQNNAINPICLGYDAAMEGAPNFFATKSILDTKAQPILEDGVQITFYDYFTDIFVHLLRKKTRYTLFNCVYPMFDNTPRRKKNGGWLFYGATPDLYKKFLVSMTLRTIENFKPSEQFLFINAWNEWGEGAHLEPDKKFGYKYLEITKEVSEMNIKELQSQTFSKNIVKTMKKKIYPTKVFSKERRDFGIRIIKFLNVPIFKYKKRID